MQPDEARRALDAMEQARESLAVAVDCPPWRHAALGAVMALLIFSATVSGLGFIALYGPAMGLLVLLARGDRKRTGTFVNGWRMGRTLPLSIALAAWLVALAFYAVSGRGDPFPAQRGLIAAALGFVTGTLASVWWQRIYIAELRRKDQA